MLEAKCGNHYNYCIYKYEHWYKMFFCLNLLSSVILSSQKSLTEHVTTIML